MHGLIHLILIFIIYLSISFDVTKASNTSGSICRFILRFFFALIFINLLLFPSTDIHWLVLHYHKTGHDLTRAIFEVLSKVYIPLYTLINMFITRDHLINHKQKELGVTYSDNEGPRRTLWKLEVVYSLYSLFD